MRTGVELTRSQKEKEQREESKGVESPPPDAPKPKELERRPVLALALVSFAGWDAEESSWPILLDEFVEFCQAKLKES